MHARESTRRSVGCSTCTCLPATVSTRSAPGAWNDVEAAIDVAPLSEFGARLPRPLKFALHTHAIGSVGDVAAISLLDGLGRELLSNADFAAGLDRWFFSTDVDPPWHIHSQPLTVLFEQGWLGVVAWTLLVAVAVRQGTLRAWHGAATGMPRQRRPHCWRSWYRVCSTR